MTEDEADHRLERQKEDDAIDRYPITCRAYYADGSPILGNLDGQRSLKSVREMYQHYSQLLDDVEAGRYKRVAYWRFETNDGKVRLLLTR